MYIRVIATTRVVVRSTSMYTIRNDLHVSGHFFLDLDSENISKLQLTATIMKLMMAYELIEYYK